MLHLRFENRIGQRINQKSDVSHSGRNPFGVPIPSNFFSSQTLRATVPSITQRFDGKESGDMCFILSVLCAFPALVN